MTLEPMLELPEDGVDRELFNAHHELTAEPHLPGFRVAVARLFPAS